jgi:ornithine--oxo-acid transaminase
MSVAAHSSRAQALIAVEERYGSHNYHPLDVVCERGKGVYLWDVDGNRYMDFLASYSAVNQGHNHPRIAQALVAQARKLALTSRAFRNDLLPLFLEKLCRLTGFDRALPMNSGAEAVETAIKASRKWGYDVKGIPYPKAEIVVAEGNFHGRTTTIVGFSTDPDAQSRFGPFTPGFRVVKYGDVEAVRAAVNKKTCAVLVEPVQGEGGVIIPPRGYLRGLREICDAKRVLLVLDEIQSGLGRTGKLFAFEHEGIRPDGVTVGKALSGGFYPVSAFLARQEVMDVFTPGIHGSTYGGNPLACAVAIAALDVLVDEKLVERAAELGAHLAARLKALRSPLVKQTRCLGLWAGIELKPEAGGARKYCYALKDRGLLCKDTHVDTIRLAPPLVITSRELGWAVDQIEEVLAQPPA